MYFHYKWTRLYVFDFIINGLDCMYFHYKWTRLYVFDFIINGLDYVFSL